MFSGLKLAFGRLMTSSRSQPGADGKRAGTNPTPMASKPQDPRLGAIANALPLPMVLVSLIRQYEVLPGVRCEPVKVSDLDLTQFTVHRLDVHEFLHYASLSPNARVLVEHDHRPGHAHEAVMAGGIQPLREEERQDGRSREHGAIFVRGRWSPDELGWTQSDDGTRGRSKKPLPLATNPLRDKSFLVALSAYSGVTLYVPKAKDVVPGRILGKHQGPLPVGTPVSLHVGIALSAALHYDGTVDHAELAASVHGSYELHGEVTEADEENVGVRLYGVDDRLTMGMETPLYDCAQFGWSEDPWRMAKKNHGSSLLHQGVAGIAISQKATWTSRDILLLFKRHGELAHQFRLDPLGETWDIPLRQNPGRIVTSGASSSARGQDLRRIVTGGASSARDLEKLFSDRRPDRPKGKPLQIELTVPGTLDSDWLSVTDLSVGGQGGLVARVRVPPGHPMAKGRTIQFDDIGSPFAECQVVLEFPRPGRT